MTSAEEGTPDLLVRKPGTPLTPSLGVQNPTDGNLVDLAEGLELSGEEPESPIGKHRAIAVSRDRLRVFL